MFSSVTETKLEQRLRSKQGKLQVLQSYLGWSSSDRTVRSLQEKPKESPKRQMKLNVSTYKITRIGQKKKGRVHFHHPKLTV